MRIGELARQAGVSVRSLRYYEERGLLEAQRTSGGTHRVYGPDAVARVRLLRQLYAAGLSSAAIASLLPCVDAPSTHTTRDSPSSTVVESSPSLRGSSERRGAVARRPCVRPARRMPSPAEEVADNP
jgi:DNA-binding transcriptional MerR regulator